MTPTGRSLDLLRRDGWAAQSVERYLPYARVRQDLFGIGDVLAVSETVIVVVQATSGSNVASRVAKLTASPALAVLRKAGVRVVVHGWRKAANGRWRLREVGLP